MLEFYFYFGITILYIGAILDVITTKLALKYNPNVEANPIADKGMKQLGFWFDVLKLIIISILSLLILKNKTINDLLWIYFICGIFFCVAYTNFLTYRSLRSGKIKIEVRNS